jgi:hypothetical protein
VSRALPEVYLSGLAQGGFTLQPPGGHGQGGGAPAQGCSELPQVLP